MSADLKAFCKKNGYSCRFSKQGTRHYVTVGAKKGTEGWVRDYRTVVEHYYPDAYLTSGGIEAATFFIGDVWEILKGK
jgi:hypothetical protein